MASFIGAAEGSETKTRPRRRWRRWLSGRRVADRGHEPAPGAPPSLARLAELARAIGAEGYRVLASTRAIAADSKLQAERVSEAHGLIVEIEAAADENVAICAESSNMVREARSLVQGCTEIARSRSRMVEELIGCVHHSSERLDEVHGSVSEVERFLEIIVEIGNQTDLLALNAAIEAARAGAQGAGFNVVAREMRVLADRTSTATEQTRLIIERMHGATVAVADGLRAACEQSRESRAKGEQAGRAIAGCVQSMVEAEVVTDRLAEVAERQRRLLLGLRRQVGPVRETTRACLHEADAVAETGARTLELASNLYEELGQAASSDQLGEPFDLRAESASLRAASGMRELGSMRAPIEAALAQLQQACLALGQPTRRARHGAEQAPPELCFGGQAQNLSYDLVDKISRSAGLTTTLFVLMEGEDGGRRFVRIATNVVNRRGQRAIGTELNPRSGVAAKLLAGEPTYGYVHILGVPHAAAYAPILDAGGTVIGATYVGRMLRETERG